jgi:D-serine deaminase-like pyridoxal phosphate-dependent protein
MRLSLLVMTDGSYDSADGNVPRLVRSRATLPLAADVSRRLCGRDAFSDAQKFIVSPGGSAYFDRVAARLSRNWDLSRPVRVVVRRAAYIAHDSGFYADISPLDGRSVGLEGRLIAALEIWGAVLSRPKPDLAIIGFGKRNVSYDLGLPRPPEGAQTRRSRCLPSRRNTLSRGVER